MNVMLKRWLADPLVIFIVLGALSFILYYSLNPNQGNVIVLDKATQTKLMDDFQALTGRKPEVNEITKLANEFIEEEILFREALEQGLHLIDPNARSSLIELMRYQITGLIPDPSEADLVQYYLDNIQQYFTEPNVTFAHIYFKKSPVDTEVILQRLGNGEEVVGDEYWRGYYLPDYGFSMLRGLFGQDFLDSLKITPLGIWNGPIRSTEGWHYIYVEHRAPKQPLSFDDARIQIENDYMQTVIKNAVNEQVTKLKQRYSIKQADISQQQMSYVD